MRDFKRHNFQFQFAPVVFRIAQEDLFADRNILFERLCDGTAQVHGHLLAHQSHQVQIGGAGWVFQERGGLAAELQHLQLAVDDHTARRAILQQYTIGDSFDGERPRFDWPDGFGRGRRLRFFDEELRGERQLRLRQRACLGVEPSLFVHRREQVEELADAFGPAEQQIAVRLEGVMEELDHLLLQFEVEVDQHVVATDQVQPGKWRITRKVVPREHTEVTDRLADAIAAVGPGKKAPQPIGRNIERDITAINSRAGPGNRGFADVRAKNLDGNIRHFVAKKLHQAHGNRIRFFAGGTTRHPEAKGRLPRTVPEQ